MNVQEFTQKWEAVELSERSASQEHFLDLCKLVGHPSPAECDPLGDKFCFEKGVKKSGGGGGWADVWKKGAFAWEYKGKHKHKSFETAYLQLNLYRENLENPPLLVVSDIARYEVHTNFTGTVKEVHRFRNQDLNKPEILELLRNVFHAAEKLRPQRTTAKVTQEAAEEFCKIARKLRARKVDAKRAAHFLTKIVFSLFAEDVQLLPKGLFARIIEKTSTKPALFSKYAQELFSAMQMGGTFLLEEIHYFDGGLFADAEVIDLEPEELQILEKLSNLDWAHIEPVIFGTLFERSLDPDNRTELGAHFTSQEDIVSIVEPVLMTPLRRDWARRRKQIDLLREAIAKAPSGKKHKDAVSDFEKAVEESLQLIRKTKVLDPACGSGNFLYVSLRLLLDLEKEVIAYAAPTIGHQLTLVYPDKLYGMEINVFAHELASVVVWIGWIQWCRDNGFAVKTNPVLKPLNTIVRCDALIDSSDPKNPKERVWPFVDVIVGNPPFLGGKLLRKSLGDEYVDTLFKIYKDRVPKEADLVCYWFEKARTMIGSMDAKRAGLLATQGIRFGKNRSVLERIKKTGDIFFAVSDREWPLDGAMVHISMVGFDKGNEPTRVLDGMTVPEIHANLQAGTAGVVVTKAAPLVSNRNVAFMGDSKGGDFDITEEHALKFLRASNPHGKPNRDVVKPWVNGSDMDGHPRKMWIIDFGTDMSESDAALYEAPFEYLKEKVMPGRTNENARTTRDEWWIHERPRPEMRQALNGLTRFIATTRHSPHRIFVWLTPDVVPDSALIVFAREDDYCFGVLQSRVHEIWSRAMGSQLREAESGFRYTPQTCFQTFCFPWPLGKEPKKNEPGRPHLDAIAKAAADLVKKRDEWLGLPERRTPERTLTELYNQNPTWLVNAHASLDHAVVAAYGWPTSPTDKEILDRLHALNQEHSRPLKAKKKDSPRI